MDRYMRQKGYGVHAVGYFKVRSPKFGSSTAAAGSVKGGN